MVGQFPPYDEWDTRHELLAPLGIAIIVLAGCRVVRSLLGRRAAYMTGGAVIVLAVVVSASISAWYYVDWQKQKALVALLKATPAIEEASTVVFHDDTRALNIFGRAYGFTSGTD